MMRLFSVILGVAMHLSRSGESSQVKTEASRFTERPVDDDGQDAGLSAVELFVGSLASYVGYFVGRYCDRHQLNPNHRGERLL